MRLPVLAVVLALAGSGCARSSADPARPSARVIVETRAGARHVVPVELARTPAEHARGLMDRRELAPDAGMLFLFPDTAVRPFWMKNTLIPLDMIFIAEDGAIVGIVERAVPGDLTPRSVGVASRYVLEVNGGWSETHGVAAGDRVRFEDVPRF